MKIIICAAGLLILAGCKRAEESATIPDSIAQPATHDTVSHDVAAAPLTCGISGKPILTEQGLGQLALGRSVRDVRSLCDVVSDSQEQGIEGMPERVVVTHIGDENVRSIVVDDKIWRLEITSPHFRTADSLGVDTPLRKLARMKGAQFFPGEDGVYGFVDDHCGLSFRFSVPMRPPKGGQWTAAAIEKSHGDAAVDRVLVTRCAR